MMFKPQARRDFACVHSGCAFKTDKRKAIYTHLVRTHSERKEDYECEYCDTLFEDEEVIEEHLYTAHPGCQFRYTCVSRLENLLNRCAQLAADRKNAAAARKAASLRNLQEPISDINVNKRQSDTAENQSKLKPLRESSLKRKTSVNESLNNLAKLPRIIPPEPLEEARDEYHDKQATAVSDMNGSLVEDEMSEFISKPSGLKIKLNLKKIRDSCSRESSAEPQTNKDEVDSVSDLREMSSLDESDSTQSENTINELETTVAKTDIVKTTSGRSVQSPISKSKSSYLENLEVYHTTDELNRRCCPFCDYKTTKNTIRVHLSGKHRIYFVMCSKCDYRAAFPYQVQAHGFTSHKVRNIEVIHLAKSYREGVIARLKEEMAENGSIDSNSKTTDMTAGEEKGTIGVSKISDESDPKIKPPQIPTETRVFKPPVCQTTKTDYYYISYENDTYLYCCNQCEFRTPVRATIYTHKYRHEEKAFKCGYCEFISAPRSNVVHHIRVRHKGKSFIIDEIDTKHLKLSNIKDEPMDTLESGVADQELANKENEHSHNDSEDNHEVPAEMNMDVPTEDTRTNIYPAIGNELLNNMDLKPQTIIKVPEYKRTLTTFVPSQIPDIDEQVESLKEACASQNNNEHKLSINKMYRYNPKGSPKYLCIKCPYACDTHPKMKHHLYRHKPQRYKCSYCNFRKYPRSYVVRHIRDTHRDKAMAVIDLVETGEIEADSGDLDESVDSSMDVSKTDDLGGSVDNGGDYGLASIKEEAMADNNTDRSAELISPNISDIKPPVHSSTPKTDSSSFALDTQTPKPSARKPVKNYDVDTKRKPRYICNFCHYGTENYKTIHNHMYRHERVKFRCPYCGFKRAPRSAVESHIREVHKGQPVITTEVVDEEADNATNGLSLNPLLKREALPPSDTPSSRFPRLHEQLKSEDTAPTSVLWTTKPAPTKVNSSLSDMPQLQIPVKPKTPGSSVSNILTNKLADIRPLQNYVGPPNVTVSSSSPIPFPQKPTSVPPIMSVTPTIVKKAEPRQNAALPLASENTSGHAAKSSTPSYREGGKTTFKTMYKCVFNTEICNHIAKDRSKMKQHLFMHVEYKPWSCDYCSMTASQSSHIKNHVRSEHPREEISFQYKQHNYLEKHIETFLQKGVFTVPVNEYRSIMDMKGSTQRSQYDYLRDTEGYFLCPHCDYRTKSGGMSDHIKMKHKQPRFKCHWCDYKAFYRSEVRKHHRKERGHGGLEFKTQELDLTDALDDVKDDNDGMEDSLQESTVGSTANSASTIDTPQSLGYEGDNSSDADSAISDSTALSNNLSDSAFLNIPYSFENIDGNGELTPFNGTYNLKANSVHSGDDNVNSLRPNTTTVNNTVGSKAAEYMKARKSSKTSLYKCGYCMFSAHLRTMVKMHCQKQHPYRKVHVAEINKKNKGASENKAVKVDKQEKYGLVNDKNGNPNKTLVGNREEMSNAELMSKIAPLLRNDKSTSGNHVGVSKKGKSLKSVIDLLSSKVQCSETSSGPGDASALDTIVTCTKDSPLDKDHTKHIHNDMHEETPAVHSSSRKQRKPQHVKQNDAGNAANICNETKSLSNDTKCGSESCENLNEDGVNSNTGTDDAVIRCKSDKADELLIHENGPPVLTKAMIDTENSHTNNIKEIDITPPLLVNEIATAADVD